MHLTFYNKIHLVENEAGYKILLKSGYVYSMVLY